MKSVKKVLALSALGLLFSGAAIAAPFTIVPNPGTTLPTSIIPGQTLTATYIVGNNTGTTRANNYVKHLPPNVTQDMAAGFCGSTFTLAPKGQPGSTCLLQLNITGPVNGNDANADNHLFVCFPGGKTCGGTAFGLNVAGQTTGNRATQLLIGNLNNSAQDIYTYPATANGTPNPTYDLNFTFDDGPDSLFIDSNNNLWAALNDGITIAEWTLPANGTQTPLRKISSGGFSVGVDAAGFIYGLTGSSINVYSPTASDSIPGSTNPVRNISPICVGGNVEKLYVLPNGTIYLTCNNATIEIYSPGANGAAVPNIVTITGASATQGIFVDLNRNIWVTDKTNNAVYKLPPNATGVVTPITISGGNTLLNQPDNLAVDAQGYIYVTNNNTTVPTYAGLVTVFTPGTQGNIAPVQTFGIPNGTASNTPGFGTPGGLAIVN